MSQKWAVFLDFDGTLVDIAPKPEAVVVPPELPNVLAALRNKLDGALALISGRAIAVLDKAMAPHDFDAAGLHGLEYRFGGRLQACKPEQRPELRRALENLRLELGRREGILIEDKGCALAVHWRMAPAHRGMVTRAVQESVAGLGQGYRLQYGHSVAEVLPAGCDKGKAIATFLRQQSYENRRALFIGDDVTDEHGFEVVNALGGVSVRVGPGETKARHSIASPAELRRRLSGWASTGAMDPENEFAM